MVLGFLEHWWDGRRVERCHIPSISTGFHRQSAKRFNHMQVNTVSAGYLLSSSQSSHYSHCRQSSTSTRTLNAKRGRWKPSRKCGPSWSSLRLGTSAWYRPVKYGERPLPSLDTRIPGMTYSSARKMRPRGCDIPRLRAFKISSISISPPPPPFSLDPGLHGDIGALF